MAYAADHTDFANHVPPTRSIAAGRSGILRRVFDAIQKSRQRRADLEIARYIARSGGRLTDSMERELMRRVSISRFGESA